MQELNDIVDANLNTINCINKLNSLRIPTNRKSLKSTTYSEVLSLLGGRLGQNSYTLIEQLEELIKKRPNKECYIACQQLGGKVSELNINRTSFIHRDSMWKPWVSSSWVAQNDREKESSLKWIQEVWEAMEQFCPGIHLAQVHDHLPWHSKELEYAFKDWLPKLKELKFHCDPEGILPPL